MATPLPDAPLVIYGLNWCALENRFQCHASHVCIRTLPSCIIEQNVHRRVLYGVQDRLIELSAEWMRD